MSGWTSNTNTSGAPRTVTGTEASGNPAFKRTRPLVQTCDPLCFVFSRGRVFLLHTDPRKAAQRPLYWIWLPIRTYWTWSHSHLMASCVQRLKDEGSNIDHLATAQRSSGKPSCGCSLTPRTTQTPSPMATFPPAGRCTPQKPQNPLGNGATWTGKFLTSQFNMRCQNKSGLWRPHLQPKGRLKPGSGSEVMCLDR